MKEHRLIQKNRISRRASYDLIQTIAKWGNHNFSFETDDEVKKFFRSRGHDYDQLVENCRNFPEPVLYLENIIGPTLAVSSGLKVSRVDLRTGKEDLDVQGPGMISMSTYWASYETAARHLKQAIKGISYAELQSAITDGIASIEGYINYRAQEWNKGNLDDLLLDSKKQKVAFDDKIDCWIPKMTGGKKLDKSVRNWSDFKRLQHVRDNIKIHPKDSGYSISHQELADLINRFRYGVSGLLIQLHQLFQERIPSIIIRSYFAPDIEVKEVEV